MLSTANITAFQSLIGKLQTENRTIRTVGIDPFQSLIGKLQTLLQAVQYNDINQVSIPHR